MRLSQRRKHHLPRPCACECDRWTPTKKRKKLLDIHSDSPPSRSTNSSKPDEGVPSGENGDDGGPSNEYGLRRSSRIRKVVNRDPPSSHSPRIGKGGRTNGSFSKSPIGLGDRMRKKRLRSPSLIVDVDASVDWDLRLRSRHKRPVIEEVKGSPITGSKGRPKQSKRKLLRDIDECILRLDETKNNGSLVEESTRGMTDRFSVADEVGSEESESDESTSSHDSSGQSVDLDGGRSSGVNNYLDGNDSCSHESSDDESSDTCIAHGRRSLRIFSKKKIGSRRKKNSIVDGERNKFIGRSDDSGNRNKMPKTMVSRQDSHVDIDKKSNLNELRTQKAGGPTAVVVVTHDEDNGAVKLRHDQLDESNTGIIVQIGEKNRSVVNGDICVDNTGRQDVSREEHTEMVHDGTENQNVEKSDMISHLIGLENSSAVNDSVHISQADLHYDASVKNFAARCSTDAKQPLAFNDTEMHPPIDLHNRPDASHGSVYQHDQVDIVHGVKEQVKALPLDADPQVDEHNTPSPRARHSGGSAIAKNEGEINFADVQKIVLSGIPGGDPVKDTIEDNSRNVASGTSAANDLVEEDKMDVNKLPSDNLEKNDWVEGRRCGLCGCGVDGKPPKKWSHECNGSDIEAYNLSASEEPNYDIWDGFGDEPGWLGRLLGPIHDRFGIAGVWVHQHCAVWSPEVYFSGLGCLKSVRAALCRGRALKCSRCGRPGATIGCRVDRCPRTYHLPCGRADGCVFDHRKFLIACTDHRHLFQPLGNQYFQRIKKLKVKKIKADTRKKSADARRKDLEAEEKWLENCGEDEEFLKREGKRLHRDISRILPIYIGGSGGESLFEGWESVAGLEDVVQCLKEVVILPLLYPEYFSNLGLTPPRGVLLHGYPGTGKTLVVRALVGACSRGERRIAYFARKGADCLGKYVGDAERQLRLLFHVAEKCQPSIIFFDEIDGLTPVRSKQQDQTHSSVVSTLLALLDGLKSRGSVIVIGATNRPDSIDPALRRPGRFDREIYFPLPSLKDRSAILALHTQKWPKAVSGSLLWRIARETAGYAGADLQALCTQAAMIALKRNCPLQEILAAAEKQPSNGNRCALPSFFVEEKDWLNALACAPPPCSRREAGIAANDVLTSPLQADLVPCLLKPFVQLLVSLYLDEFIFLPPLLHKAGKKIKDMLLSTMVGKHGSSNSWWSNLCSLLQESDTALEVEKSLSSIGLIGSNILFNASESFTLDDNDCEISDVFDMKVHLSGISSNRAHLLEKNRTGFRVLIAGSSSSGQKHLASSVLHGFEGNVEIHKVNLATISQEGRGDLVQGITNILMKCQRSGLCILYMPRIDLWAIDNLKCEPICTASGELGVSLENSGLITSEAWNSLVGHIDSMCSTSLIIVATCEMPSHVLPLRVKTFFKNDMLTLAPKTTSARKEPFFLVSLDGRFNWDLMCNISAEKLSRDLICLYIQIIHNKKHPASDHFDTAVGSFPTPRCLPENHRGGDETSIATHPEALASKGSEHDLSMQCGNGDNRSFQAVASTVQSSVQPNQGSDSSIPSHKTSIKMKSLQLAIATFGFQILKYPHFAELCWVTSKLKEGPCTYTYGPWKGWPFNSCVARPCASQRSIASEDRSAKNRSVESNSVVRGLVAVGLLAYRGAYKTVLEVSLDVRKVLELLVAQIRAKILDGKDRYRFLRILSQVAYLEDVVNTWAYSTQRLELDGQILDVDSQPSSKGSTCTDAYEKNRNFPDETDKAVPANCEESHRNIIEHGHVEDVKQFGPVMNSEDGADAALHKGTNAPDGSISSVRELALGEEEIPVEMDVEHPCNAVIHIQTSGSDNVLLVTQSTSDKISADDHLKLEEANVASREMINGKLVFSEQSNADVVSTTICSSDDGIAGCADLSNGHAETKSKSFSPSSASSSYLCQYECCSKCLHLVYHLIREVLMTRWKSAAHTTLEDAHHVVASCSAMFLAAIRKLYAKETNNDMENAYSTDMANQTLSRYCLCPVGSATGSKETSNWPIKMEMELVPTECNSHLEDRSSVNAPFQSEFKVFIRDYTVLLSDAGHDVDLHCKLEHICLCSLIRHLLEISL
ncbi:ATPase family AAA domain-containing protein 2 [Nymphaea thermarum]|nr:ATPase family AAA domain-containing protein 2 [Nymphaea thermarum]